MIDTALIDGTGTNTRAKVIEETQALCVQQIPYPPIIEQIVEPFRQYLTTDGTASGSNDMGIDASGADVDFFVPARADADRYISTLSFIITATGNFTQNEFANDGSGLSNGCRLFYTSTGGGEIDIHEALKTNFDYTRLSLGAPSFGDTANAFRGTNFVGTAEAMMPVVRMSDWFPPFGIKLDAGSAQRLTHRLRDNCAGATTFDIIAFGFDRLRK